MSVELKFYLWPSSIVNDHVALEIEERGVYISWSPSDGKKLSSGAKNFIHDCESLPKSLQEDYAEEEGRQPKDIITFKISRSQAEKIKSWWDSYRRRRENYKLHVNNCCHIVLKALTAAFPEFGKLMSKDQLYLYPGELADFMRQLRQQNETIRGSDITRMAAERGIGTADVIRGSAKTGMAAGRVFGMNPAALITDSPIYRMATWTGFGTSPADLIRGCATAGMAVIEATPALVLYNSLK